MATAQKPTKPTPKQQQIIPGAFTQAELFEMDILKWTFETRNYFIMHPDTFKKIKRSMAVLFDLMDRDYTHKSLLVFDPQDPSLSAYITHAARVMNASFNIRDISKISSVPAKPRNIAYQHTQTVLWVKQVGRHYMTEDVNIIKKYLDFKIAYKEFHTKLIINTVSAKQLDYKDDLTLLSGMIIDILFFFNNRKWSPITGRYVLQNKLQHIQG